MASSPRSPKDLKKMLNDSKQEMDEVHRSLEKLRCLSHDEKTETGMLRSRIDEQSSLICMLKQRADEMLCRCQALERINSDLEAHRADVQTELDVEKTKSTHLDKRFMDLAENHQAMINFKDEYKRQNATLKQENERLWGENDQLFSPEVEKRDAVILKLSHDVREITEQYRHLKNEYQEKTTGFLAKHQELILCHQAKETSLTNELHDAQRQLKDATYMCTDLNQQLQKAREKDSLKEMELQEKIESLVKEKDKFLNLSMQRGKQIQEKQEEVLQLEARRKEEEKARIAAEERFEREAAAVTADVKVMELQHALAEAIKTSSKLRKDFEAYKDHSTCLLTKEMELNAKLRHVIG